MRWKTVVGVALAYVATLVSSPAQTDFHQVAAITALPDRTISLELAGSAPPQFRPYFDLYLLEASSNAVNWSLLATLLRTNSSDHPLLYVDSGAGNRSSRFYRTFMGPLPTPFPKTTGPHVPGTTSILLTDPSRSGRYNVATNSSFMITLWYPALPGPSVLPAAYVESKLAAALAGLYGTSAGMLAGLRSSAFATASIVTDAAPYPVIVYSHGFKVDRRDNTATCEELASHGYVVVSVDHADCLATVFPDDRLLTTTISGLSAALFESHVKDIQFVLEALALMNRSDPVFRNTLNLGRIGTMGWSYGGGVAAEICRTDNRVKATVLLDAYLQNARDVAWLGIQKPFLGLYNATSAFTTPFDQATRDAYWMRIQGAEHQHFADWRAWINSPTTAGRRAAITMHACIVSFFDKYLKDQENHLLDNPAATYPEVIDFLKK